MDEKAQLCQCIRKSMTPRVGRSFEAHVKKLVFDQKIGFRSENCVQSKMQGGSGCGIVAPLRAAARLSARRAAQMRARTRQAEGPRSRSHRESRTSPQLSGCRAKLDLTPS